MVASVELTSLTNVKANIDALSSFLGGQNRSVPVNFDLSDLSDRQIQKFSGPWLHGMDPFPLRNKPGSRVIINDTQITETCAAEAKKSNLCFCDLSDLLSYPQESQFPHDIQPFQAQALTTGSLQYNPSTRAELLSTTWPFLGASECVSMHHTYTNTSWIECHGGIHVFDWYSHENC